jgi:hypothetical protein
VFCYGGLKYRFMNHLRTVRAYGTRNPLNTFKKILEINKSSNIQRFPKHPVVENRRRKSSDTLNKFEILLIISIVSKILVIRFVSFHIAHARIYNLSKTVILYFTLLTR